MLSHSGQVSLISPLAFTPTMQCFQRQSTFSVPWLGPSSGPGGLAAVASRHGRRPMGKVMLGPSWVRSISFGLLMFGSSPR